MATLLRSFLESRGGAAPWRDWMEAALYDPENGYYTRHIRTVGRRGDFSTSATLGGALACAMAAWIKEEWRRADARLPLIEIGPGDGSLHAAVRQALGWSGRIGLRSHLVERSPVLRAEQERKLRDRRIAWHPDMSTALHACDGKALILSNELADAFPVTLLQRCDGAWQEVWLALKENGAIAEELRPAVPDNCDSSACRTDWPDGQRVEVLHSWRAWLNSWRAQWRRGAMLTVDYGGTPAEIYHRRRQGTVRGYRHHQRLEAAELYAVMGRCDITADVNFTDLREWGEAAGLTTAECVTQHEFVTSRTAVADSLHGEGGAAEAFQCLVQRAS
jgi:SAM-dependent MidA family methyltransferase